MLGRHRRDLSVLFSLVAHQRKSQSTTRQLFLTKFSIILPQPSYLLSIIWPRLWECIIRVDRYLHLHGRLCIPHATIDTADSDCTTRYETRVIAQAVLNFWNSLSLSQPTSEHLTHLDMLWYLFASRKSSPTIKTIENKIVYARGTKTNTICVANFMPQRTNKN